jgi:hypothetical protein
MHAERERGILILVSKSLIGLKLGVHGVQCILVKRNFGCVLVFKHTNNDTIESRQLVRKGW